MTVRSAMMDFFKQRILSPQLDRTDAWEARVRALPSAHHPTENSPVRFNIPREAFKLEGDHMPLPGFPGSFPQMVGSMVNIRRSVYDLEKNPSPGKTQIDAATLQALIDYAHQAGVDEVGFASVPTKWIFQDTAIAYNKAIVLVMEMSKDRMDTAPSPDTAVMVHETYNALGQVSNRIAEWLRDHGFGAHAGHPLGGMALYPPMAQAAGLGWRGINGLVITPRFGPRVRLAAVFTEIENLPVHNGDEHAWVLDFCEECKKCIRDCPPEAFFDTPIEHENGLVTVLDNADCFPYFAKNHGCSICIKVCPFNQHSYEKIKSEFFEVD